MTKAQKLIDLKFREHRLREAMQDNREMSRISDAIAQSYLPRLAKQEEMLKELQREIRALQKSND